MLSSYHLWFLFPDLFFFSCFSMTVAKDGPEARLFLSMAGGLAVPIGWYADRFFPDIAPHVFIDRGMKTSFMFGWSQGHTHWIVPLIGTGILMLGIFCVRRFVYQNMQHALGS
jgi:hypothetical protein